MSVGLIALLDDVAAMAKLAASSLDDVSAAAAKASSKATGVVIDDAAVTPRYVTGLTPDRELPIIYRIALGSVRNKLLFLLPAALLLSALAPWALTPLLMLGGAYLCYEGAEKLIEKFLDVSRKFVRIPWNTTLTEQNEHVETVVEQIDEATGRAVGCRFLRSVVWSDGEQARGSGHGVTAINSIARSR